MMIFQCLVVFTLLSRLAAQSQTSADKTSCDEIRNQMTTKFRQNFEKNLPATYLVELLPLWVESSLPQDCVKKIDTLKEFNLSSSNDSGGPLGTLGPNPGAIFTTSVNTNQNSEANKKGLEAPLVVERLKRSRSSLKNLAEINENPLPRDKRNTDHAVVNKEIDAKLSLSRKKRFFLNGFPPVTGGGLFDTLPADPAAPPREVTEGEIMMKNLLMFSRFQKARLASEYGRPGRTSGNLNADKPSIGGGMYGDSYHGRKKRATASRKKVDAPNQSRTKRFLFPFDPEAQAAGPDMFSLMTGTATDPNTGKRLEFGGDAMRNMMVNSYLSTLPLAAQPPPGKEPGEFVKNMAPLWYISRMQRLMSPVPRYRENYIRRKASYDQKRNSDGYYGDRLPGKRRRRRAAVPYEGEVITVGEVLIPIDLFKGREKALALMMTTSTKQPSFGKGFYGDALTSPAKVPSKEVMSMFRQMLRQNQQLRTRLKIQPQDYGAPVNRWDVPPQSPPNDFGFQSSPWNNPTQSQSLYTNQTYPTKIDHNPPPPRAPSPYDPFYQQPLLPTPPTVYAKRPAAYPQIPPTENIIYAQVTPRRPVDPFILLPATKDNADPFQQSIDPFIPNPTTPPPTTTTPLPSTAEPGRRKRSADDASASDDNALQQRFRRSDRNHQGDALVTELHFPGQFWNDVSQLYEPNTSQHISSPGTFNQGVHSTTELSPGVHSSYFAIRPLYFSSENSFHHKPSYASPRGGVVYGDQLPWSSTAGHPAKKSLTTGGSSRVKRSDRENIDPLPYRSHRGGVVYGDTLPWSA